MSSLSGTERRAFIRAFCKLRGISLSDIARRQSVSTSTISAIAADRARSERLETAIAVAVGLTRKELWPERHSGQRNER